MMAKLANPKHQTKELILETGYKLIATKGFNNTGLMELLKACNIPKGSFYHFFSSKEDFGFQLVDRVTQQMFEELDLFFKDTTYTPLQRLQNKLHHGRKKLEDSDYQSGCLFGSLAQEMAGLHPEFRERLAEVFNEWRSRLVTLLTEAKQTGEIPEGYDEKELAELFINTIEGTLIRCKVVKNSKPFLIFEDYFFYKLCNIKPRPPEKK